MAVSSKPKILAFKAGADLSAHENKIVKFGANAETVVLCGAGEKGIGVLMNAPTLGSIAEVAIFGGGAKVKCVGVVSAGNGFASDANGFAVAPTAGQWIVGIAFETSVANQVIHAELHPHYLPDGV